MARRNIEDWEEYKDTLNVMLGQESKLTQKLYASAAAHPQRVVFAEGAHPTMLRAAVQAKAEGLCHPILLGNDEIIAKLADELDLSLEGIEVVNLRHPSQYDRRHRYAEILTQKRQREGYTLQEAGDKMYDLQTGAVDYASSEKNVLSDEAKEAAEAAKAAILAGDIVVAPDRESYNAKYGDIKAYTLE